VGGVGLPPQRGGIRKAPVVKATLAQPRRKNIAQKRRVNEASTGSLSKRPNDQKLGIRKKTIEWCESPVVRVDQSFY